MEQFATEEQQVEAIKRFWKENGMAIIVGAALGLGGLWGWRYYTDSQIAAQEAASEAYQTLVQGLDAEQSATQVDDFVATHGDSGYALMASLILAQQAVEAGDLEGAANHLQFVADKAEDDAIQAVASIRLARIQVEQQQLEPALTTLASVVDDAFTAHVDELKGDIYVKQAQFDKARAAYSAALEENANNTLLKTKLDNLAVAANANS